MFENRKDTSFVTKWFIGAVVLLVSAGSGCEHAPLLGPDNSPPTLTSIQANIFDQSCALSGCHAGTSPRAGLNLSAGLSYSNLVGVQSTEVSTLLRVNPSNPDQSYLVKKIQGDVDIVGAQMPFGRPALTTEQIETVREWISAGASDN